jgi:glucose-1-phosphate cytidylyltransferase
MVEIGGKPVLWHIMRLYAAQGFDHFIVAAGYKGEVIEDYFATGQVETRNRCDAGWRVEVVDTGQLTQTGGRLLRLAPQLHGGRFLATYGDGLADLDARALVEFHRRHGRIATVTAVRMPAGRRALPFECLTSAGLGPAVEPAWVSGGFFVFEPELFDYLDGDEDVLEQKALTRLAEDGELMAYRHEGFWQCMDTPEERRLLERMWDSGIAPWTRVRGLVPIDLLLRSKQ